MAGPQHIACARNATPSIETGRYEYSKQGGLKGFKEAIGKLKRGTGFMPELSVDSRGNPRIDRGPQGPIEWVISFIKGLIFPNAETEKRQAALAGLEAAIKTEGQPTSKVDDILSNLKVRVVAIADGVDTDATSYAAMLRDLAQQLPD